MIKMIRLLSGEDLIADITKTSDGYTVSEAVVLVYQQVAPGQMSVGFAPFMPYADGALTIKDAAIAAIGDPNAQMVSEYNRVFSKIEIAPASMLSSLK